MPGSQFVHPETFVKLRACLNLIDHATTRSIRIVDTQMNGDPDLQAKWIAAQERVNEGIEAMHALLAGTQTNE